jgi:pimeloyl-ACP methyl ester carboxylesterase
MILYLNGLTSGKRHHLVDKEQALSTESSAIKGAVPLAEPHCIRLILAGYSYGSMIASHLPGVECVMRLFPRAAAGSAESEIQLRASHLSSGTLKELEARQERHHARQSLRLPASQSNIGSPQLSPSVMVGGFESEAAERRIDRRRSLDVRKSLDRVREKIHVRPHRLPDENKESEADRQGDVKLNILRPQISYLLISPVLPPVATFATFFSTLSFKGQQTESHVSRKNSNLEVARCPSLAVYGSRDPFTAVKKLRTWAREVSMVPGSVFQYHEVEGAGHFWRETDVLEQMKQHIKEWESSL